MPLLQAASIGGATCFSDFALRFWSGILKARPRDYLMRVTVSHDRPVAEVKQAVDRSFDDLFKAIGNLPIQLVQEQRSWNGDKLAFSLVAKMGILSTPVKGMIEVTDGDITIDVDLGLLERLIPAAKGREALGYRLKGLLK
jgi:Putative polyhydroxyalkanoic acid system protein (PHA_gran_rgn)